MRTTVANKYSDNQGIIVSVFQESQKNAIMIVSHREAKM